MRIVGWHAKLTAAALAIALCNVAAAPAQQSSVELRTKSIFIEAEQLEGFAEDGWTTREGWGVTARARASGDATASAGGPPGTELSKEIIIPTSGTHRIWAPYYSPFAIRIDQQGETVYEEVYWQRHVVPSARTMAVWEAFEAELNAGPATLTLYVADPKLPKTYLHVDCLLITPFTRYKPDFSEFGARAYVRFKVVEPEENAYVARLSVLHHRDVRLEDPPGYLSASGQGKRGDAVPAGEYSAWGEVTKLLDIGEHVTTMTFRFRSEPEASIRALKIELDVATGPGEQDIVKTLREETEGDTVSIILPGDVAGYVDDIELASEQTAKHKRYVSRFSPPPNGIPKIFPVEARIAGWGRQFRSRQLLDAETAVLAKLGINTLMGLSGTSREVALEHGIKRSVRSRYVPDVPPWAPDLQERVEQEIEASYDYIKTTDPEALPTFYRFKLAHLPEAPSPTSMRGSADCVAAFREYLKAQNISLQTLGRASWDEVKPTWRTQMTSPDQAAVCYYTMKFRDAMSAKPFALATEAVRKRFPKSTLTSVTFDPEPIGRGSGMIEGPDWFECGKQGAVEMLWSMDGGGPRLADTPLLADLLRAAARANEQPIGLCLERGPSTSIRFRTYSALAHGAKALRYYRYGPHYATVDGAWSDKKNEVQEIGRLTREIGQTEGLLYPGKRPKAKVALVYSKSSDIWQDDDAALAELRQTYFALLVENIPVDFLTEEEIADGALGEYRACYIFGPNLTRAAAEAISNWVLGGGMLYGCLGAGWKDEFNRPSDVLVPAFGLQLQNVERVDSRYREYYDLPKLETLTRVTMPTSDWVPGCGFEILGHRGYITLTTGQTLGSDEDGRFVVVSNKYGEGEALYVAALPALSWRKDAPLTPGYVLPHYSLELGKLLTAVARHADAYGPVRVSHHGVESGYLASDDGAAVPLLNWTQARVPALTIKIADVPEPKSVESIVRGKVKFKHFQGELELMMSLGPGTDMLLIRW